MLEKLKSILQTDAFSPTAAVFPGIDSGLLASRLGLKSSGRKRGKAGQPETDSSTLDSIEMKIVSSIEEHRRAGIENYETHRRVYDQRLARASEAEQEVKIVAGTARTDFASGVKVWQNTLSNAQKDVAGANQGLDEFRERHRIRRPARERPNLTLAAGLLMFMIVIESVLNGVVFAENNTFGLIGGAGFAFLISLVNVAVSSAFGYYSRFKNHRFWGPWLFGWTLVILWVVFALVFNLGVAHFRDAVVSIEGWEAAGQAALTSFMENPLGITSLSSVLLFCFGTLISVLAFLKAQGFDDPYPGYGHMSRAAKSARERYAAEVEMAITSLVGQRDDAVNELREAQNIVATNIGDAVDALFGQSALQSHLKTFLEQCDVKVNELLSFYRDANRAARNTPAPEHFNMTYAFEPFTPQAPAAPRKVEAEVRQAKVAELVDEAISEIFAEFSQSLGGYDGISDIEQTKPFGDVTVQRRAEPRRGSRIEPEYEAASGFGADGSRVDGTRMAAIQAAPVSKLRREQN